VWRGTAVDVLHPTSGTLIATLPANWMTFALSPDGHRLYVVPDGARTVHVVDAATLAAVRTIPLSDQGGSQPYLLGTSGNGHLLFLVTPLGNHNRRIDTIDVQAGAIVRTRELPNVLTFAHHGSRLVAVRNVEADLHLTILDEPTGTSQSVLLKRDVMVRVLLSGDEYTYDYTDVSVHIDSSGEFAYVYFLGYANDDGLLATVDLRALSSVPLIQPLSRRDAGRFSGMTTSPVRSSCGYVVAPLTTTRASNGQAGQISVTAAPGCPWNSQIRDSSWLWIDALTPRSGPGSARYNVQILPAPNDRTDHALVAGRTFTLHHDGSCNPTLEPGVVSIGSAGGQVEVQVRTPAPCAWTPGLHDPWIADIVTQYAHGSTGPGSVRFRVGPNGGPARVGSLTLSGSTLSISQASPPQSTDLDGDGLPNDWESRFGLNPAAATGEDAAAGDPDHDGRTNVQEYAAGTHPRGFFTRFLPEGARNAFFDARFAVLNVGNQPARLLFRFLQSSGSVLSHHLLLPHNRRGTIDGTVLSQLTMPDFSTALESDQPIVLDRTMTWANGLGSHAETGVPSPSSTWYLAEGATAGDFSLFYLLQNPNPAATVATVKYLLPGGQAPITMTYPLAANSRTTIFVDAQAPRLAQADVSAVITTPAGAPIIVERAMYRSIPTQPFVAGHGSSGVTAPSTHWFFAEGATGPFFDCFILLANPGLQPAQVTINYLLDDGRTFTKAYTVPAEGRYTVYVDAQEIPAGSGLRPLETAAVSSTVQSDVPIIAERAMWWPGPAMGGEVWTEAHNSPGTTVTGTRWALAEGEVGGAQAAETFILIANTSDTAGSARVTLYFADGTSAERTFPLLPRSRRNVIASADFPTRPTSTFSAVVDSLSVGGGAPAQLVVERAMYTSPGGLSWTAGTNALATRLAP
jgi:hypothetical protein